MIPIGTPTGTEIVALRTVVHQYGDGRIEIGAIYTIECWVVAKNFRDFLDIRRAVVVCEQPGVAWRRDNFRLLDLGGLDALLTTTGRKVKA